MIVYLICNQWTIEQQPYLPAGLLWITKSYEFSLSHVQPCKQLQNYCSNIKRKRYNVSFKKISGGRKKFSLVKMSMPQGDKIFVGKRFAVLPF